MTLWNPRERNHPDTGEECSPERKCTGANPWSKENLRLPVPSVVYHFSTPAKEYSFNVEAFTASKKCFPWLSGWRWGKRCISVFKVTVWSPSSCFVKVLLSLPNFWCVHYFRPKPGQCDHWQIMHTCRTVLVFWWKEDVYYYIWVFFSWY